MPALSTAQETAVRGLLVQACPGEDLAAINPENLKLILEFIAQILPIILALFKKT